MSDTMSLGAGLLMSRRRVLSVFGHCGGLILLAPFINKPRVSSDDDFIVIDGWVLRADDVFRKS